MDNAVPILVLIVGLLLIGVGVFSLKFPDRYNERIRARWNYGVPISKEAARVGSLVSGGITLVLGIYFVIRSILFLLGIWTV